ncbi:unnamed protein product [Sphagnum balticum]
MNGGSSPRGYTIVEVMVFLAISSLMFLIAASFISGKQASAEFKQGINEINSQIQETINDVANGDTASNSNFTCISSESGLSFNTTANSDGSNLGCVTLGKVIQFDVANSDATTNLDNYNIYTVVGRQFEATNTTNDIANLATTLSDADPEALAPGTTGAPDFTKYDTLDWGLQVTKMTDNGEDINGVGFFSDFGGLNNGGQQSGSQTVQVLPFGSGTTETALTMVTNEIDSASSYPSSGAVPTNPDILICFDGPSGEYGSLSIGDASTSATGQRLTTSIQVSNNTIEGC